MRVFCLPDREIGVGTDLTGEHRKGEIRKRREGRAGKRYVQSKKESMEEKNIFLLPAVTFWWWYKTWQIMEGLVVCR
jgi:hypothetical protein